MTLRVDELFRAKISVEAVLTKNAMKYSKEFIDGMNLVRGVENDLNKSQDIIHQTQEILKTLQEKLVVTSMEVLKMHRRKKRMEIFKKILVNIYKRFH